MTRLLASICAGVLSTGCFLFPTFVDVRIPEGIYRSESSSDSIEVKDDTIRIDVHLRPPAEWKLANRPFKYVVEEHGHISPIELFGSAEAFQGWQSAEFQFDGELIVMHETTDWKNQDGWPRWRDHATIFSRAK